jgi:glutathione S-transferase
MNETFEYRWVDVFAPREQRRPDFQAASRYGEIPVLVDDGESWAQSNSILLHLAGKHRTLGGEDPLRLEQARERLFWEANRIGLSLPNYRHYLRFAPEPAPAAVIEWLRARMELDLARLEEDLRSRIWLLGAAPSIADISCAAYLLYADAGVELARWPCLDAWLQRIRALPRYVPAHALLAKPA